MLISAVAAQVQQELSPSAANLGAAFADLAVTGRRAYADFASTRPREGASIEPAATARLVALGIAGWTPAMVSKATTEVLDRAYQVAWLLRAQSDRGGLGWIAVSGEDDLPHRPVNVPRTRFPQHDLYFTVPGDLGEVAVQTRFAIATAEEPSAPPALPASTRHLPPPLAEPTLPEHDRIILFINGSDSRLEEANDLIPKLVRLPNGQPSGYTVITMDLPGSGYASLIDHTEVGLWAPVIADVDIPIGLLGPLVGLPPTGVTVPVPGGGLEVGAPLVPISLLPFTEKFIIRFVAALGMRLGGREDFLESRITAVVGGSLGGNLALRLARRQAPWLRHVVAWDAGSVWRSMLFPMSLLTDFGDNDTKWLLAGVSGAIPKADARETAESRDKFFAEVWDQGLPPSNKTQPEQWYRDDFWAKSQFIANARLDRRETYTSQFRRWHWRISLEELMWSWRDPTLQDFKSRILLGAGTADDYDPAHFFTNTAQLAVELAKKNIDGDTFFFNHTGHSVHAEHPQALATKIMAFLEDSELRLFAEGDKDGIVAFDVIRKDLLNTKPVWQGIWTTGWTNFQIFSMGGKDYLFGHKGPKDGTAAFDEIRSDLHNTKGVWKGTWTTGWTNVLIFSMGGTNYLLAYKRGNGTVHFDEIPSDLQSTIPRFRGTWSTGWTHFQIFSMGGTDFLFLYKAGPGTFEFDAIPSDLQNTNFRRGGTMVPGWTNLQIFSIGGKTFLFRYRADDGTVEFVRIFSDLKTKTVRKGKRQPKWTNFQIFSMEGKTFLFGYRAGDGSVEFDEIRSDLTTKVVWKGTRTPGSTSLQIFPMT